LALDGLPGVYVTLDDGPVEWRTELVDPHDAAPLFRWKCSAERRDSLLGGVQLRPELLERRGSGFGFPRGGESPRRKLLLPFQVQLCRLKLSAVFEHARLCASEFRAVERAEQLSLFDGIAFESSDASDETREASSNRRHVSRIEVDRARHSDDRRERNLI